MSLQRNCMLLGVFIDFFGVKIVIGLSKNHCDLILIIGFDLRQKTNIYRYFTDIYRYFFRNSNTCTRKIKARKIAEIWPKYQEFSIFR